MRGRVPASSRPVPIARSLVRRALRAYGGTALRHRPSVPYGARQSLSAPLRVRPAPRRAAFYVVVWNAAHRGLAPEIPGCRRGLRALAHPVHEDPGRRPFRRGLGGLSAAMDARARPRTEAA